MHSPLRTCCLAVAMAIALGPQTGRGDNAEEQAQEVIARARQWHALLDGGSFGEAWDYAASTVRNSISREQFAAGAQRVYARTGKVVSRQIQGAQMLPGAPGAAAVLVSCQANYERFGRVPVYDYLILVQENDRWMVGGIFSSVGKPLTPQQLLKLADGRWRWPA